MKDIIIITAFGGRNHCFDKYAEGLLSFDYPKENIIYVVSDGSGSDELKPKLEKLGESFKTFYYFKDDRKPMMGVTAGESLKSVRIASVYQNMANVVKDLKADFVLSIEDDIVAPPDALKKLLRTMEDEKIGCAFGRQICRWMEQPLAWQITWKKTFGENDINEEKSPSCKTLPVRDKGIEYVDGMPMGFNLIRKDVFDREVFRANDYGITGFDLIFSLDIKNWGYDVVIDWSIHCKHYHEYIAKYEFGSYTIKKEIV